MATTIASPVTVGERVHDGEGFVGTVRYVGPVATSKSTETLYAGIEWDAAGRGKNDGSVTTATGDCVRYFSCEVGRGSFLKLDLVKRGRGLLAALAERYLTSETCTGGTIRGVSGASVPVQFVGDEQVRARQRLDKLTSIVLRTDLISHVEPDALRECVRLKEVDLRGNLLWTCASLITIGQQLSSLTVLDVSDNRFTTFTPTLAHAAAGCMPRLRTLILNHTGMTWAEILLWNTLAPELEELHACQNELASLVPSPATIDAHGLVTASDDSFIHGVFPHLRVLNLSDNALTEWGQVYALSRLPSLRWLLLANNGLRTIWSDAAAVTAGAAPPFPALEQLSLSGNALQHLSSLDSLDAFPSLTTLRMSNTDIAAAMSTADISPSEARQVIIARLPHITSLNNSEVRPRERDDAEKAYARRVGVAFAAARGVSSVLDIFPPATAAAASAELTGPASAAACAAVPDGAHRDTDTGVIRAVRAAEPRRDGIYLATVSSSTVAAYVPILDPAGLGAAVPDAAAALQQLHPRYFLAAAKFDLHAAAARDPLSATSIASAVVAVTLRPMSGNSCMMDAVTKKLPASMTIADLKALVARLFKCDIPLQRLSFRDSPSSYPALMDDDMKAISYYAVTDGGDILIEEVDAIAMQKEADKERRAREAKMAQQAAAGDALRKAQEQTVLATRQAVAASASAPTRSAAGKSAAVEDDRI